MTEPARATRRRLATRFVLLAAAQTFVLAFAAVAIWWFTGPRHHHDRDHGPAGAHGPPPGDHGPPGDDHGAPPDDTAPLTDDHAPPSAEKGANPDEPHVPGGPLLTLGVGFVVLAVGAFLTARWIVRPLEQLSRTARSIGEGDLDARTNVKRDDEIGVLAMRLDEMAGRIQRLVASERELLANVAHELRTPLSRIGVALDLAAEGDAARARASLEDIAVDVQELETLVDDILITMRFEFGRAELPLRRTPVEPGALARTAAERLRGRHPERPVDVKLADDLPEIDVDPVLFRRVVDNLLENAHKYTPDRALPIDLAVTREGDTVVFAVTDRGVGIAQEDLPHVFTAFFRSERSRSRETGGVGLGLTLARRIAEAHSGSLSLASTPGSGTTARLVVPV